MRAPLPESGAEQQPRSGKTFLFALAAVATLCTLAMYTTRHERPVEDLSIQQSLRGHIRGHIAAKEIQMESNIKPRVKLGPSLHPRGRSNLRSTIFRKHHVHREMMRHSSKKLGQRTRFTRTEHKKLRHRTRLDDAAKDEDEEESQNEEKRSAHCPPCGPHGCPPCAPVGSHEAKVMTEEDLLKKEQEDFTRKIREETERENKKIAKLSEELQTEKEKVDAAKHAGEDCADCKDRASGESGVDGNHGKDGASGASGENGVDGKDGAPGEDGADGKDGAPGHPGENGVDGKDGAPGEDGADGKDGAPGHPGVDGADGKDGAPGKPGVDGADGKDGAPGQPGVDGADGKDGAPGLRGLPGPPGPPGPALASVEAQTDEALPRAEALPAPAEPDWICNNPECPENRKSKCKVYKGAFDPGVGGVSFPNADEEGQYFYFSACWACDNSDALRQHEGDICHSTSLSPGAPPASKQTTPGAGGPSAQGVRLPPGCVPDVLPPGCVPDALPAGCVPDELPPACVDQPEAPTPPLEDPEESEVPAKTEEPEPEQSEEPLLEEPEKSEEPALVEPAPVEPEKSEEPLLEEPEKSEEPAREEPEKSEEPEKTEEPEPEQSEEPEKRDPDYICDNPDCPENHQARCKVYKAAFDEDGGLFVDSNDDEPQDGSNFYFSACGACDNSFNHTTRDGNVCSPTEPPCPPCEQEECPPCEEASEPEAPSEEIPSEGCPPCETGGEGDCPPCETAEEAKKLSDAIQQAKKKAKQLQNQKREIHNEFVQEEKDFGGRLKRQEAENKRLEHNVQKARRDYTGKREIFEHLHEEQTQPKVLSGRAAAIEKNLENEIKIAHEREKKEAQRIAEWQKKHEASKRRIRNRLLNVSPLALLHLQGHGSSNEAYVPTKSFLREAYAQSLKVSSAHPLKEASVHSRLQQMAAVKAHNQLLNTPEQEMQRTIAQLQHQLRLTSSLDTKAMLQRDKDALQKKLRALEQQSSTANAKEELEARKNEARSALDKFNAIKHEGITLQSGSGKEARAAIEARAAYAKFEAIRRGL